jgi:hypothetical protein
MRNYKKIYRDLEMRIMFDLRKEIQKSKYISKHVDEKAIKVNIFNYEELTIINGGLTFLDSGGLHYSIFAEANLEDLIEILYSI